MLHSFATSDATETKSWDFFGISFVLGDMTLYQPATAGSAITSNSLCHDPNPNRNVTLTLVYQASAAYYYVGR